MLKITSVTADPYQKHNVFLPDGSAFSFLLYFRPQQLGWFLNDLTYQDFTLQGLRITNSPNMLFQFMNQIPFGLACFSKDDREPTLLEDFVSESSILYVLTEEECQEYLRFVRGQV
jgi:hypothetical protein